MSTNPVASLPPIGPQYGPCYFGIIICTAFYGITCMQTFFYYVHYQNDPMRMKSFVAALWVLDTIHEALGVAGVYNYMMAGLVDPTSILIGNPELTLLFFFTAAVAVPSQGFLVYRIYVFSGKNIVAPLLWVLLAILQLVTGIIYIAKALYSTNGVQAADFATVSGNPFSTLVTLCLSVSAGVDILIAVFLTFLLVREWTPAGFASTQHMLQRLTVFAVNTGIWTAMFALLTVILLHVFPTNVLYMAPGISIGSLYCNTILANLNARAYLWGGETANIVDVELFTRSSVQPETTKADRPNTSGEVTMVTS